MPYPRSSAAIEVAVEAIANGHPTVCTRSLLTNPTHQGRRVSCLKIGKPSTTGAGRYVVVLTGGVHGREWAPPDALVSLVDRLLTAYQAGTTMPIPAFTDLDSVPPVTYPAAQIPARDVRGIVEELDLYVVPLVNPDGRATSQAREADKDWRKNRSAAPTGSACEGVDLNRNFPFPGDYQVYYNVAAESDVSASKDPCDIDNYVGTALEPEVRNVMELFTPSPVDYFVDVHSWARKILHPWAVDGNQAEPARTGENWHNPVWNRGGTTKGRDGAPGGPYDEYFPNQDPHRLLDAHDLLGKVMRDAILDAAGPEVRAFSRSWYDVEQAADLYPAPGTSMDWAFSRNIDPSLTPPLARPLYTFTIECGSEENGEGGWHPPVELYPKIEREIHLAVMALLAWAAMLPGP
jgi:hypothetical protein